MIFAIFVVVLKKKYFDFFKIEEEFDEEKFEIFLFEILKIAKILIPNIYFLSL